MNTKIFLHELAESLGTLSEEERNKVLDYYNEMICDEVENGKSEETVIQDFGSPEDIAEQICVEYGKTAAAAIGSYKKIYSPEKTVDALQISAQNIRVEIHEIAEGKPRILFNPLSYDKVTVTEQDNVYSFTHTVPFHFLHFFFLFHLPQIITLEVPVSYAGNIFVKTSNARVTAEHLRHVDRGTFTTNNARIIFSGITCSFLELHTSNGKIELSDCSGNICNAKTSNGRIAAANCSFPEKLSFHTNNGSINAAAIISDNIRFKTSNSAINATITGDARDYSIHSHTSNGRTSLPSDWSFTGQKCSLSAETSNGHIDIKFSAPIDKQGTAT